jgi:hypothetical protein
MRDKALEEDLKAICSDPAVPVDQLAGRKILVTGATGLIGSNLVKLLLTVNLCEEAAWQDHGFDTEQGEGRKNLCRMVR